MIQNLMLVAIVSAIFAFVCGLILAFATGYWQWLTLPLLSFLFFHSLLRSVRW
jgi:hypothetical protein